MRWLKAWLGVVAIVLLSAGSTSGQATTGTITGRVVDPQGGALPGVTVTTSSPNLQGTRTAVTGAGGEYLFSLLPPGTYTLSFELSGFDRQERSVGLAPTQEYPLDIALGLAGIGVSVNVEGGASVLVQTAQVATDLSQDLIDALPTNRDINAALLLASVHATGPNGGYSISGGMTFDNLFLLNGVTINENLRGQPHDLYVEDAIQETIVASAGVSAEFGRFGGGVVNVITKSGGNNFSGSLRDTLNNDAWRKLTPFSADTTVEDLLPTYEYTLGGPIMRDRLWFFTAGRLQNMAEARTLAVTNGAYEFTNALRRYEGKATYSVNSRSRLMSGYTRSTEQKTNESQGTALVMDRNSLIDTTRDMNLFTVNYYGILTPRLAVEARYSVRNETLEDFGSQLTDPVGGTLLLDASRSFRRYWSPTFCGVCDPEERDNQNLFLKGSYFFTTTGAGSHNTVFGYDGFNDRRFANNHQSGSDYRIYGTSAIITGETVTPVFLSGPTTVIQWNPILVESLGTNFRTHGLFFSDSWRVSSSLTANLGLRFDKNDGVNSSGDVIARDSAWSPRLGAVWDPTGGGRWSASGSFARYVSALTNTIANTGSAGGSSDNYPYVYQGPSINANGVVEVPAGEAVRQVFEWFDANGGTSRPLNPGAYPIATVVVGATPLIRDSLVSPNALEYAGGISRRLGSRATVRADMIYRTFHDFYDWRTDLTTGTVTDTLGRKFDLTLAENTNHLERQYAGLSMQGTYRAAPTLNLGATYTLSRTWGNIDGEGANGPTPDGSLQYPEYKQAAWNYPDGDLSIDQRHRARIWATYGVSGVAGLMVSVLQTLETGVPYGAVATTGVDPRLYVTNPGYLSPPSAVTYYLTPRDAFRTEGQRRTDVAVNYAYQIPGRAKVELFGQLHVLNIFNQSQLCGCGQAVNQNGGAVNSARIDQTVRLLQPFNPFTTVPVEGVQWAKGQNFGTALNRLAYTSPRAFRVSFGVRF